MGYFEVLCWELMVLLGSWWFLVVLWLFLAVWLDLCGSLSLFVVLRDSWWFLIVLAGSWLYLINFNPRTIFVSGDFQWFGISLRCVIFVIL